MPGDYLTAKRGTELPWSKMNEKLVALVRTEHAEKERMKRELDAKYSAEALAKRYGVSTSAMNKILTFQTWRHVR